VGVKAVFFDAGETLVDETRLWAGVADEVGVPHLTFFGVLGAFAARGVSHRGVFEVLGVEAVAGAPWDERDLYPDAEPCLRELQARGLTVGVVGNASEEGEALFERLGVDVVGSSGRWGVAKPAPEFFARLIEEAGAPPAEVVYVGDRIDNDVVPAAAAGLAAVHIRRGPWGYGQSDWPEASRARARIDSLSQLPEVLAGI
jgi:HAD superfamily hydrolase (TIGR01662 family)